MRRAIVSRWSRGAESTRRLRKLKRTARTPSTCRRSSSESGDIVPDARHAPGAAAGRRDGVEHRAVVRAVATRLDNDPGVRYRGGRGGRTAVPSMHRMACTCARVRTGTGRPGRIRGSARRHFRPTTRRSATTGARASQAIRAPPRSGSRVRLDDVEAEAATAALEVLAEADANRSPRHVSTYLVSVGRIYPDTVRSPGVKPSRTRT